MITLENNSQVEVGENSLLSFDRNDRWHLTQGAIDFRLPPTADLSFKAGDFTVIRSTPFQAFKKPLAVSPDRKATIGSISVHSNGAVTVKSLQGSLFVLNQKRVVLAALSSKDTVTLPSVTVNVPSNVMVAQASEKGRDPAESSTFLGIPIWVWTATISGLGIAAITVIGITTTDGDGDETTVGVCP